MKFANTVVNLEFDKSLFTQVYKCELYPYEYIINLFSLPTYLQFDKGASAIKKLIQSIVTQQLRSNRDYLANQTSVL